MFHFVSGYTSKLAGTERGITEPQATFSTCFGAPFLPLDPSVYAEMLGEKVAQSNANVYLINTGWSGGSYGVGKRMSLKYTRAMVTAALTGALDNVKFELDPIFNVYVPTECPNVPAEILNPKNTWADKAEYDKTAKMLAARLPKTSRNTPICLKTSLKPAPKHKYLINPLKSALRRSFLIKSLPFIPHKKLIYLHFKRYGYCRQLF